ncbi:MAG: ribonuclease T [Gammaproteobacteria bacterium]|nr:ribonuclease T [Gammaproteobacteria bacterium]
MPATETYRSITTRFRGFLPVVVDIETGGFNPEKDALLEIGAVLIRMDSNGLLNPADTHCSHVQPFHGANLDPKALAFNKIVPDHPFRHAISEVDALKQLFTFVQDEVSKQRCSRAILIGHNPAFDLSFLKAAIERCKFKKHPFHSFSTFDTATLAGLAYEETVLSKAVIKSGDVWDNNKAHSAIYDAEQTAKLFCKIVNLWQQNQTKNE